MPKSSKRPPKSSTTSFKPTIPSPPPQSTKPTPFTPSPPTLSPFLTTLSPSHIYITHLDTHPRQHKRTIFLVPLTLNTLLALGLLYRAYIALPTYFSILLATLGYDNDEKVDWTGAEWGGLAGVVVERMGLFLMDYMLWAVVGGWPWEFFGGRKGETGPVGWRWGVGFKEVEVVVRRSRRWDERLLSSAAGVEGAIGARGEGVRNGAEEGVGMKVWASDGDKIDRDEDGVMRERIMPAVAPAWLKKKTGYAMLDKSWDLDFGAMVEAHELVVADASVPSPEELGVPDTGTGPVTVASFATTVFVYERGKGWLAWPVWKLEMAQGGEQDAKRRSIVQMKDRLTAMGKENLFFAWVEMVQFESSVDGGFTVERQRVAVEKARRLFEAQGVNFQEFWAGIEGGVEGMMGMEVVK